MPEIRQRLKGELPKEVLEMDSKLSCLQNFVLDAVGLLYAQLRPRLSHFCDDPRQRQAIVVGGAGKLWNGSSLKPSSHFLKIQTDASKLGW